MTPERLVASGEREILACVQVDVLTAISRTPLDLDGDVEVLAVALRYLAHAHGLDLEAMALRAVASATRGGPLQ